MVRGTKTGMATYGGEIHDYIFFRVRFEKSTVAKYAGKFMTTYFFAYNMSNQLCLRIAGYINYLSSTYVFISSFVSLTKYAGQKLKTMMWLRMARKFMSTYFFAYNMSNQQWLRIAEYIHYLSSTLWLQDRSEERRAAIK